MGKQTMVEELNGIVVTFVVPTFNEQDHIGGCLRSIRNLQLPPQVERVEMVVVDNLSTDATVDLAEAEGAKIVSIPPETISRSRNVGAAAGTGQWVAFIDADCELHPRGACHEPRDWCGSRRTDRRARTRGHQLRGPRR